ncbi:hypothetical protein SPB21_06380 [Leptothoe sp. ISB3NOV94-8A]
MTGFSHTDDSDEFSADNLRIGFDLLMLTDNRFSHTIIQEQDQLTIELNRNTVLDERRAVSRCCLFQRFVLPQLRDFITPQLRDFIT